MLQKRSKICDEARAVEKPKIEKRPKLTTTTSPELKFKDERTNATFADECDCNSKDTNLRLKCNCPTNVETSKTLNQSPIVSNEVERKSFLKVFE